MEHGLELGCFAARPVDGLRGWIVTAACFCSRFILVGVSMTTGIYYVVFLREFKEDRGKTAIVSSLVNGVMCAIGPVSGMLVHRFGHRATVMAGGLLTCIGLVLSSFATDVNFLIGSFGLFTGSALGLAATASSTAMVHHFDQWLDVSVGIVSSAGSLGILVYPFLLDYLLMEYGWRGSLLIVAGMNLNVCVCGALMFPAPNETSQKESNAQISNRRTHQTLCGMLKELMTNKRFIFLASSCVLSLFGVSVFSSHMPAYAVTEAGLDAFQVPPLLSAMGLAGFLSRIILGFLMKSPRVSTLSLFILFNLLGGVVVACIPATKTFAGMFVLSSLFGVSFAANGPVLSRLLIIYTRLELFPIAYGYAMIACGFGFILGAPCAGWIYDITHGYQNSFYIGGGAFLLSGLIMILPSYYKKQEDSVIPIGDDATSMEATKTMLYSTTSLSF